MQMVSGHRGYAISTEMKAGIWKGYGFDLQRFQKTSWWVIREWKDVTQAVLGGKHSPCVAML